MLRSTLAACLVTALALVSLAPRARAQDEVSYLDASRKTAKVYGVIQAESPSEIVIQPHSGTNRVQHISASDVLDVRYHVPTVHRLELQSAINSESAAEAETRQDSRRKLLAAALRKYQELSTGLNAEESAKRHIEFKVARLMALAADLDAAAAPRAIDQLAGFIRAHPDSWQLGASAFLRARLQLAQGDVAGAQKTYEDLAGRSSVAAETARAAQVRVIQLEVRGKHYEAAAAHIAKLSRVLKPDDAQAQRLQVLLAVCTAANGKLTEAIESLQRLIGTISDSAARAEAYNALGDCYRLAGKPADARWPYLAVDVLCHQDADEHARALYALVQVFHDLKDDARSAQFREQLQKDGRLSGTEYQRLLERTGENR